MKPITKVVAGTAVVLLVGSAHATPFTLTFSGTVIQGQQDAGIFGPDYIIDGKPFVATYTVDDGVAGAEYVFGPGSSAARGGTNYTPGSISPMSATLAIDGFTYAFINDHLSPDVTNNSGGVTKAHAAGGPDTLSIEKDYGYRIVYGTPDVTFGSFTHAEYIGFDIDDASGGLFGSADWRELLSVGLPANSIGFFSISNESIDRQGMSLSISQGTLAIDRLTVQAAASSLPEPSTSSLWLAGLGVLALFARRPTRHTRLTLSGVTR